MSSNIQVMTNRYSINKSKKPLEVNQKSRKKQKKKDILTVLYHWLYDTYTRYCVPFIIILSIKTLEIKKQQVLLFNYESFQEIKIPV